MTLTPAQRRLLERVAQAEADGTPLHVYRNPETRKTPPASNTTEAPQTALSATETRAHPENNPN